jgi:hypothetical protein
MAPETTIRPPYQPTYIVSLIQYRYKTCTANGGGGGGVYAKGDMLEIFKNILKGQ